LQKIADRINSSRLLGKIISSFIILTKTRDIFAGINSTAFKVTHISEHYNERAKLKKRKYAKLSIGANVLQQIICNIRIRQAPTTRHDNIDFKPIVKRIANIIPLSVITADKAYDSEDNRLLVREESGAFSSVIPAQHKDVPIRNTHGRYRKKQMKLDIPKYCTVK